MSKRNHKKGVKVRKQALKQSQILPTSQLCDPYASPSRYSILRYGAVDFAEMMEATLEDVLAGPSADTISWINVEGIGDVEAIQYIGEVYHLHSLALEDVVNLHQRPKLEAYQDVLFIVTRMPHPLEIFATEQVSFFLGTNFLITFQEGTPGDCFEHVRQRLRTDTGRLRQASAGYLLYALLDTLVDQFFPQLECHAELLQNLEDRIIGQRPGTVSSELYTVRRHLLLMHHTVRPLRDVIAALMHEPMKVFDQETRWSLRDVYDHTNQLLDLLETYKALATQLLEMAALVANARMGEIMRVLTIMSSIFIPLTFIVGIYGMNFNDAASPLNMPELSWYYGYPTTMGVMLGIAIAMLLFFRYKGWLGSAGKVHGRDEVVAPDWPVAKPPIRSG